MPFCTNCGNRVDPMDRFCAKCGAGQPAAGGPAAGASTGPPPADYSYATPPPATPPPMVTTPALGGVSSNLAAMLCYLPGLGWVAAILFLAFEPYRQERYVRFHAFQGLYLFVAWLMIQMVFMPWGHNIWGGPFWFWDWRSVARLLILIAQIIGIIKTLKHETYRLPVLAELADKSLA